MKKAKNYLYISLISLPNLLFLFLGFNLNVMAGMYPNGSKWYFNRQEQLTYPAHGYTVYEVVKDTLVLGLPAKLIVGVTIGYDGNVDSVPDSLVVREDNQRVYWFDKAKYNLMYDFNLIKGDTLKVPISHQLANEPITPIIVDSVSSINIEAKQLKVQHLSWSYVEPLSANQVITVNVKIIENVGCEDEFIFAPSCGIDESFVYTGLRCCVTPDFLYQNNYWHSLFPTKDCNSVISKTTNPKAINSNFKIFATCGQLFVESKEYEISAVKLISTDGSTLSEDTKLQTKLYSKTVNYKGVVLCVLSLANGEQYVEKVWMGK